MKIEEMLEMLLNWDILLFFCDDDNDDDVSKFMKARSDIDSINVINKVESNYDCVINFRFCLTFN